MEDIVPKLYEDILNEFNSLVSKDTFISEFNEKLNKKEAEAKDVSLYGEKLGRLGAQAFLKYIKKDNLPDGILYWNIVERTIKPLFQEIYKKVNESADIVQQQEDKYKKIGLKPQESGFPEYRIHDLIDKAIKVFEGEEVEENERIESRE